MNGRSFGWLTIGSLAGLIVGYFIGREHLKYEIRTSLQVAATEVQKNLQTSISKPVIKQSASPLSPRQKETPPLTASLIEKGFHNSNPSARDYQDAVTFSISFSNETGKEIRAFDGVLSFADLLDNDIIRAKLSINESIPSTGRLKWDGQLDYNQFMDAHRRLRSEDQSNLKVRFFAGKILFSDGTMKKFGE